MRQSHQQGEVLDLNGIPFWPSSADDPQSWTELN
jgi:hypothetical protein